MNPTFYDITQYGAVGDGTTLSTSSIQAAVDAAAEKGGTVLVPPGCYLTGTVVLRSRVTLYLCQGAKILGSPNLADYTKYHWGHHDDRTPYHLIYADGAHHIAICGEGEIDGNGQHYCEPERKHEWAFWREIPMRPSPMVEISRCTDIRIENVRLTNPGGWTLHLHDCDRAFIRGITIDNSLFRPNSDGIDLTGCHDTIISDCFIHTGDDAIALKSTIDSRSCEHITVTNCVLETSCAALRVGYESDQDFLNCTFSNITIKNCSRAIDLLTFAGGNIENISFTNIVGRCMSGWPFDRAIEICAQFDRNPYKCKIPEHPNCGMVYPERPPGRIRGITITNVDLETCGRIMMAAAPGKTVEDISLDHIRLRYPMIDDPLPLGPKAEGNLGFFKDMPDVRGARSAFIARNIANLRVRDYAVHWPTYPINPEQVELLRSPNRMANPDYYGDTEAVVSGRNAPPFHAFQGIDLIGGCLESSSLQGSMPGVSPIALSGCTEFRG